MQPSTKEEFINTCLILLGQGMIEVNVTPQQAQLAVDRALIRFYEHHHQAVETVWGYYSLGEADLANNYITLDNDIIGVSEVHRFKNNSNIFSVDFQMQLAELNAIAKSNLIGTGVNYYYSMKMHLELLEQLFAPERQWDFNYLTHKLVIAGGLADLHAQEGAIILKAYRKIHGEADGSNPTNTHIHNIWKNKWLQDYCTELIRLQWAQNLSKYQNIQLLGGVVMNGNEMKAEAMQNIAKLEEDLMNEFSLPPMGYLA